MTLLGLLDIMVGLILSALAWGWEHFDALLVAGVAMYLFFAFLSIRENTAKTANELSDIRSAMDTIADKLGSIEDVLKQIESNTDYLRPAPWEPGGIADPRG